MIVIHSNKCKFQTIYLHSMLKQGISWCHKSDYSIQRRKIKNMCQHKRPRCGRGPLGRNWTSASHPDLWSLWTGTPKTSRRYPSRVASGSWALGSRGICHSFLSDHVVFELYLGLGAMQIYRNTTEILRSFRRQLKENTQEHTRHEKQVMFIGAKKRSGTCNVTSDCWEFATSFPVGTVIAWCQKYKVDPYCRWVNSILPLVRTDKFIMIILNCNMFIIW